MLIEALKYQNKIDSVNYDEDIKENWFGSGSKAEDQLSSVESSKSLSGNQNLKEFEKFEIGGNLNPEESPKSITIESLNR